MYSAIERQQILNIARESIQHTLEFGSPMEPDPGRYSKHLQEIRATFVTLKIDDLLRGCIGNIVPRETLVESVARNAYSAAFHDPRFGSLIADEFPLLNISVSVLSELQAIAFSTEQELLEQLRPGTDGLVITAGEHSATFLPSVWEQLPDPQSFLNQLKEKAGLAAGAWPADITAERYTTYTIAQ